MEKIKLDINAILDILNNNIDKKDIQKEFIINCIKDSSIELANAITSIICILNPKLIILAGGLINFDIYKDTILQTINDNMEKTFDELMNSYNIIIHEKHNELVVLGALEKGKEF